VCCTSRSTTRGSLGSTAAFDSRCGGGGGGSGGAGLLPPVVGPAPRSVSDLLRGSAAASADAASTSAATLSPWLRARGEALSSGPARKLRKSLCTRMQQPHFLTRDTSLLHLPEELTSRSLGGMAGKGLLHARMEAPLMRRAP
jgi:hypothetical protein